MSWWALVRRSRATQFELPEQYIQCCVIEEIIAVDDTTYGANRLLLEAARGLQKKLSGFTQNFRSDTEMMLQCPQGGLDEANGYNLRARSHQLEDRAAVCPIQARISFMHELATEERWGSDDKDYLLTGGICSSTRR